MYEESESAAVADESQSEHDIANESDNTGTDDLGQKLAEMFDLPTLSENTEQAAPEDSLEERLQKYRDEDQPENTEHADTVEQTTLWQETVVSDAGHELATDDAAADLSFDPLAASDVESGIEYESETLDEFPAGADTDDSENKPASDPSSVFEPEVKDETNESINDYMERLLARNRQVAGVSDGLHDTGNSGDTSTASRENAGGDTSTDAPEGQNESSDGPSKPETWLDDTPRHQQNRDQVRAEVQVLRQIANQSARSAVATASRRDVRDQVLVKGIATVLSIVVGMAWLMMNISLVFGLIVLGVGMFFTVDLSLTVFRNQTQTRELKKAAAAIGNESDANDSDTSGSETHDARSASTASVG